jgi:hypothetical protein
MLRGFERGETDNRNKTGIQLDRGAVTLKGKNGFIAFK